MPLTDIAIGLEIEYDWLEAQADLANSEVWKALQKGRIRAELKIRKTLLALAQQGSTPAIQQFQKLKLRSLAEESDRKYR